MNYIHKQMAAGGWQKYSSAMQMANIGTEVMRAINWQKKGNASQAQAATWRALELVDLSKNDPKNMHHLKEFCRLKEVLGEYYFGDNKYQETPEKLDKYFLYFNSIARKELDGKIKQSAATG